MRNLPLVSVIIPSYNSAHFLERSIGSVLNQTYKNYEIIVVDDGSTDDTSEVVKVFSDNVIYHRQENKGLAGARNAGLKLAKGEFIQLLDADDYIHPEKLEKQISAFTDDDVSVVYSDYVAVDANGSTITEATERMRGDFFDESISIVERLMKECFLLVHAQLTRAEVFRKEGGFDENRRISEDWDMWLRIASRGYKFKYLSGIFAYYVKHDDAMTTNHRLLHDRRLLLLNKFMSDENFRANGGDRYNRFCSYQYRALANDCWNFKDWKGTRIYLKKSFAANPGDIDFRDYFLFVKTFAHQIMK